MKRRMFLSSSLLGSMGLISSPITGFTHVIEKQNESGLQENPTILSDTLIAKDVCAWPKMTIGPEGKIYGLIFNQPIHGAISNGDVELWVGSSEGKNWKKEGVITNSNDQIAYYNHAIGINAREELVIMVSGWTKIKAGNINYYPHKRGGAYLIKPLVGISKDMGKTWNLRQSVPSNSEGINLIPFGSIEKGGNGHLRVAAFVFRRNFSDTIDRVDTCYILKSEDDGLNWEIESIIGNYMQNETDIAYYGNNTWFALCRKLNSPFDTSGKGHNTEFFISEDNAKSWRSLGPITMPGQHPGDILVCKNGKLIVTYGNRIQGKYGIAAKVSYDMGKTWSEPFMLTRTNNKDSGYPSSVELHDGSIATGYYAKGGCLYDNYYFGLVKWNI